ncbi:MAG: oligosaccharide flippase family protein [Planctomycetota bacterium]|nr:oligosaccharide flippase family protein [Planctomycetota bacterium]
MRSVVAAQLASQLVSFVVLAVLFRQLGPVPFGLLGMVMPLLLLARMLGGLSLQVASVQRPELSTDESSWLFWAQVALAGLVAVGFALSGHLLAWAFSATELIVLCYALSATLLIHALGAQHLALLEREMAVGQVAKYRFVALFSGGSAAVLAAWQNYDFWALVIQQYVELSTLAALAWWNHPFRPAWPKKIASSRALVLFGSGYSLSGLLFFLAWNLDKVVLAVMLGAVPGGQRVLGIYTQTFNLMMRPVYLVTVPVSSVMLPALSRASRHSGEFSSLVICFYRLVGIVLLPCGVGLALVADDLMRLLGGSQWVAAGTILSLFAPAILALGWINIAGSVLAAAARTRELCWCALVVLVVMAQGYLTGGILGKRFGAVPDGPAVGVAMAFTLVSLLVLCIPYTRFVLGSSGASFRQLWRGIRGALLATLVMGVLVWALRGTLPEAMSPVMRLAILVLSGVVVYGVIARREVRWAYEFFGLSPGSTGRLVH